MNPYKEKNIKKAKFLILVGIIFIMLTPFFTGSNLFYFPIQNLYLEFIGLVFFDGLEFATIIFFVGLLIICIQMILLLFHKNEITEDKKLNNEVKEKINEFQDTEILNKKLDLVRDDLNEVDDLLNQLDSVIKKSRHDVFNLMLDSHGVNSPDDFQSAVESLELALSSLRSIQKINVSVKKNI
tara:strand:+ start:2519 stop:3067 length:549 start_codon:yes stop_codon:yes gene_type:complete